MLAVKIALHRTLLAVGLLMSCLVAGPVQAQPALSATPDLVPGEGSFRLLASGLSGELHRVSLWQGASPVYAWTGSVTPSSGRLDLDLQVPSGFTAGSYTLVVSESRTPTTPVVTRPFAVSAPIATTLLSEPGPPGATVRVRLDDLVPGELSLTWDDIRVHGPVQNTASSLELEFTSPGSTPVAGQMAFLQSRVLAGGMLIARGGVELPTVAPPTTQPVAVRDLVMPAGPRLAGQSFTVSGRLQTRLPMPPNTQVRMVTQLPNGMVLPLSPLSAPLAPDGSFSLVAFPRDLLTNAPVILNGQSGQDRLVFSSGRGGLGMVPAGIGSYGSGEEAFVELQVKVRDPGGQPLAGALVVLDSKLPLVAPPEPVDPLPRKASKAPTPVNSAATQILARPSQAQTPLAGLLPDDLFQCPVSLARGYTDAQGLFLARIPLKLLQALNFKVVANAGGSITTYNNTETEVRVLVNAKPALHTFATNSTIARNQSASLIFSSTEGWLVYNPATREYDQSLPESNALIEFTARPLTGPVPLDFQLAITQVPKIGNSANPAVYGPITTLPPGKYPGTSFQVGSESSLRIEFDYNEALEGILSSAVLLPASGNTPLGSFTSFDGECELYDKRYVFNLPNARELPHGDNRYRIRIRSGAQLEGMKEIALRAAPPPVWFADPDYGNRVANWKPHAVTLSAQRSFPERQADGNPPNIGNLRNRSQGADRYSQLIQPSGHGALIKIAESTNETVNRPAPPKSGFSSDPLTVFELDEELLDTGWIPLFRFAWGVPPIAAATFGADARFWARLFIKSSAQMVDGKILADLTTRPSIGGAINAFFNFSAVLGLVDMDASFTPGFALAVTTVVKNSELNAVESEECFRFILDVAYAVSVGLCPLCIEFGDSARVVDETSGSGSCPIKREILAAFAEHRKAGGAGVLQRHPPSLAFDALGAGSLATLNASGELELRELTNAGLGAALNLGKARGASAPQHVYYAPGKALLVHERSSFSSDAAFLAATIEQGAASRNLVWRNLSGGTWSTAQNLTPLNHGDGQVSLAVCPDGEAGCPAGGEVLAVWVHDPVGQVFGYRFEVWHALFRNGSWTAPARVDDPGPGSDMHPRASYVGGQPLVSWVRTPTRSIAAAPQRRLMTRFLNGAFPATEVDGAPQGVLWQDLASDGDGRATLAFTVSADSEAFLGNQAELWFAQGDCAGGSCSWTVSQQRDAYGRALRAESPSLTRAADGSVRVAFRSLGYSPNAQGERVFPGDSLGQVTGSGELVALEPRLGGLPALPQLLSSDGLVHFAPVLRRNPISGELVSLSAVASQPPVKAEGIGEALGMALGRSQVKQAYATEGLALARFPDVPDFMLEEAIHTGGEFTPGGAVQVKLLLRNAGGLWQSDSGMGMNVYASWDSAPEYRRELALGQVTGFPANGLLDVTITVPVPADFLPDQGRELVLNINGDFLVAELGLDNNLTGLRFGDLPAPEDLVPVVRSEDRYAFLEWTAVADERVVGYAVYRSEPEIGEPWAAIGSSFEPAFLDFTALPGRTYAYRVVGYSENGFESAPSNEVLVEAAAITTNALFKTGFEEGAPEEEIVLPETP